MSKPKTWSHETIRDCIVSFNILRKKASVVFRSEQSKRDNVHGLMHRTLITLRTFPLFLSGLRSYCISGVFLSDLKKIYIYILFYYFKFNFLVYTGVPSRTQVASVALALTRVWLFEFEFNWGSLNLWQTFFVLLSEQFCRLLSKYVASYSYYVDHTYTHTHAHTHMQWYTHSHILWSESSAIIISIILLVLLVYCWVSPSCSTFTFITPARFVIKVTKCVKFDALPAHFVTLACDKMIWKVHSLHILSPLHVQHYNLSFLFDSRACVRVCVCVYTCAHVALFLKILFPCQWDWILYCFEFE